MQIDKPGKVSERIIMLGRKEACVYLLKGDNEYVMIGGGMIHAVPEVLKQLEEFGIDEGKIKRIIILHSHFDHCGFVPFFKRRWPQATVTASRRAKEILARPEVLSSIQSLNKMTISSYGREKESQELGLDSFDLEIEQVLADGEIIKCGDLTMKCLDVPGHSSCSIAIYVPEEKALFASDAGGIPFGNKIFVAANSNFDQYQASLEKMAKLDIKIHLAEHFGGFTGKEGREFLVKVIREAKKTRKMLEESYTRTKDVELSTNEITDRIMEDAPDGFLPRNIIVMVVGQMMKYIAKTFAS